MLKKIKTVSLILALLMVLSTGISGCGEKGSKPSTENDFRETNEDFFLMESDRYQPEPVFNEFLPDDGDLDWLDEESRQVLSAPESHSALPENSYRLIRESYNAGKISREEAARLSVMARFDNESIPAEYRSDFPIKSVKGEIHYLVTNWDTLEQTTKEAVEPYLLPITDKGSIYNPDHGNSNETDSDNKLLLKTVKAAESTSQIIFHTFMQDGRNIDIAYTEYSSWTSDKKEAIRKMAGTVEEAIKHSWEEYRKYLNVSPTKDFLIELVEMPVGELGEEWFDGTNYRIRINYRYAKKTDTIKSTTAHELFHAFQEEMNLWLVGDDIGWVMEATAVWAENYAYPDLNIEHDEHPFFFMTLDWNRIQFNGRFEYSSYMLFYFLTDYAGQDFIKDMFTELAQKGNSHVRKYLNDAIKNAKDTYSTFALYNWNTTPMKKYSDNGPINGFPNGNALTKKLIKAEGEENETVKLKAGALKYYYYSFDVKDPKLKHVTISFEDTLTSDEYVKRQAIVKIDGQWRQPEDWSGETYKEFCRISELENEKIEALVLVYSNSDFTGTEEITVDGFSIYTEDCPEEMEINVTAKTYLQTSDYTLTTISSFTETLKIKDHFIYLVKDVKYSYETEVMADGKLVLDSSGGFSDSVNEPEIENSFSRLLKSTEDNIRDAAEAYSKFGISDNIPPEGVLITIPALLESTEIGGTTNIYLPEPFGQMVLPGMIYDGLTTIGGIYLKTGDWRKNGISTSARIDIPSHINPVMSMFTFDDFGAFMDEMESIPDMEGYSQDMDEALSIIGGLDLPEIPGLGGAGLGGQEMEPGFGLNDLNSLIGILNGIEKCPDGATFYVEFEVDGDYIKFHD